MEFSHHEGAPGQGDRPALRRRVDHCRQHHDLPPGGQGESPAEHGVVASFIPKPFTDHPGSGMHTHVSLFEGDSNAFFEPGADLQLSVLARQFIAGLLSTHQRSRRSPTSGSTPTNASQGMELRVTSAGDTTTAPPDPSADVAKPAKGQSTRIEFRSLDSATNPYLAYALILAAGAQGHRGEVRVAATTEDDVWSLTDGERRALGPQPRRQSRSRRSRHGELELVAETLGEHVFDFPAQQEGRMGREQTSRASTGPVPVAMSPRRSSSSSDLVRSGFADVEPAGGEHAGAHGRRTRRFAGAADFSLAADPDRALAVLSGLGRQEPGGTGAILTEPVQRPVCCPDRVVRGPRCLPAEVPEHLDVLAADDLGGAHDRITGGGPRRAAHARATRRLPP